VVINTSGPWVDQVCGRGVRGESPAPVGTTRKIGGTKGSHLFVERFPGAPTQALYVEALTDGRPFFILPWLDLCLIGTTDIRFDGDLEKICASDEEIDYLLQETNRVIPSAQLHRDSVVFTYAGVRPLPYSEGKKTSSITRSHVLYDHRAEQVENMVSLIGGKLTTHRQVGEEMVDAALKKQRRPIGKSPTRTAPLPGAVPQASEPQAQHRDVMAYLATIYGTRAAAVLALMAEHPELGEPIVDGLPDIKAQIVYSVQSEMARTYLDICRRRTALAVRANYGIDALPVLETVLKQYCGWSQNQCDRNRIEYVQYMRDNCIPDYHLHRYESLVPASVG